MDIAQIDDPFPIQTARHDRPVYQNGRLAAKRVAEAFAFILRGCQTWPLKLIILIQINTVGHPHAAAGFHLFLDSVVQVEFLLQNFERLAVAAFLQVCLVILGQIPQSERENDFMLLRGTNKG